MFRLISLLVVVAVMAIMWLVLADSTTSGDCGDAPTTTIVEAGSGLAKVAEKYVREC